MKKTLSFLLSSLAAAFLLSACNLPDVETSPTPPNVTNFEECVAAGNPVMESYPRQCRHDGKTYTEEIEMPAPDAEETMPDQPDKEVPSDTDAQTGCETFGGKWIAEADECEGIPRETCEALGGNFNECASACRNDPEAEICTLQCVLVCEF